MHEKIVIGNWALLKLFVGNTSTVFKYSHQNNKIHPLKYYTNPSVQSVMLDHTDTESFIPDNTNNTIDNLGEYTYSKAYSQTNKKNGVYGW